VTKCGVRNDTDRRDDREHCYAANAEIDVRASAPHQGFVILWHCEFVPPNGPELTGAAPRAGKYSARSEVRASGAASGVTP